jgi:hypothetical protein
LRDRKGHISDPDERKSVMSPPEEPSNAELARLIEALTDRVKDDADEHADFHTRMTEKVENLASSVQNAIARQDLDRQKTQSQIEAIAAREDRHDKFHQEQERTAEERKERGASTALIIVGILGPTATIFGAIVALVVH